MDLLSIKKILFNSIKILFLFIISNTFFSCLTSKVGEEEYLLTKNEFKFKGKTLYKNELGDYIKQKPNKKMFMFLPFGLWMYNLSNQEFDASFEEFDLIVPSERSVKKLDSIFDNHKIIYKPNKNYWFQRQFNKFGSKPVIVDESQTKLSAERLKMFFKKKGYYDTEVSFFIKPLSKKSAKIIYTIEPKKQTIINNYTSEISDVNLNEIYNDYKKTSFVRKNSSLNQFDLEKEVYRLENIYKNFGYFDINKNREIYFEADTLNKNKKADLKLIIEKDSSDEKKTFTKYYLNKISIHNYRNLVSQKINPKPIKNSEYKGYIIKSRNEKYNLSTFTNLIILEPNKLYSLKDEISTKRRIDAANNFDLSDFKYTIEKDSLINLDVFLTPKFKYDLDFSNDLQYSSLLNFGFSPGINLKIRNLFKGAENLDIGLQGTFGSVQIGEQTNNDLFNASDITLQGKITYPRILFPYANNFISKRLLPSSELIVSLSRQHNIGLGQVHATTGLNYIIHPTERIKHRINLLNGQLVNVTQADNYFNVFTSDAIIRNSVYDRYFQENPEIGNEYHNNNLTSNQVEEIINNDEIFINQLFVESPNLLSSYNNMLTRKFVNTTNTLNNSFVYEFEYNQRVDKLKLNPIYFNFKTEYSGLLFHTLDNLFNLNNKIFGLDYTEFIKFDFDIRKTWVISAKQQLAFRQFVGIAFPLNDSQYIPFDKSYFMGGSNDLRAWTPFTVGPAGVNFGGFSYNTMKLLTSFEYRFPISGPLYGGLFVDAGNIWSTKKDNPETPENLKTEFKLNKFINELAIGSGFGFRYDLKYLIIRFDFAYKIANPLLPLGQRFDPLSIKPLDPVINFAINYPF